MTGGAGPDDARRAAGLRQVCDLSLTDARPERLGVAVSGGSDSMALLDLMIDVGGERGIEVRSVTVDHGLRPEARDEAAAVAAFCAARGVSHDVVVWRGWDGAGNLQGEARKARYRLMADWARARGVGLVALGHTRDDQAETVLMRMARQSGVDGLSGMRPGFKRDGVSWIRPLLGQDRSVLRAYLESRGIAWSDDPSNDDDTFERVRARRAMACLKEVGIDAATLAAVADTSASARAALDHYARREVAENGAVREDRGDLILSEGSSSPDRQMPDETGRRLRVAALGWISGSDYPPRRSAMLEIDVGLGKGDRHSVAGCLVSRVDGAGDTLRMTREYNAVRDVRGPTDAVWDGRWVLCGPHAPDLEVRALGEAVKECPGWRDTGMPRLSLLASPSVWRGAELIAAPLAGLEGGWTASATGRGSFTQFLLSR